MSWQFKPPRWRVSYDRQQMLWGAHPIGKPLHPYGRYFHNWSDALNYAYNRAWYGAWTTWSINELR